MDRRNFIRRIIGVVATLVIPIKAAPRTAYNKLFGIPYHLDNAPAGTWMGITRSEVPQWSSKYSGPGRAIDKEVLVAIRKMMDDAVADTRREVDKEIFK